MAKSNISKAIEKELSKRRLFYVTRDLERAAESLDIKNYHIITNRTPFAQKLAKEHTNIYLIPNKNSDEQLDTAALLEHKKTKSIIQKNDCVLVFKNTTRIEEACQTNGWAPLNPSAALANTVEEKISQVTWLGELEKLLPEHKIDICQNLHWRWKKFILQFNHSHTGTGTVFIDSKKTLEEIKKKFPLRDARVSEFIEGPIFTNNNLVWGNKILFGNINYQITGLSPFTDNKFATIGNDWALPHKLLTKKQAKDYKNMAEAVGRKLLTQGWKGLFGIDAVLDQKTGKFYLIEINARQPASTTYESTLQSRFKKTANEATTFEAHLASLLGINPNGYKLTIIFDGAQILQRVTTKIAEIKDLKIKTTTQFNIIKYQNSKIGSDLARIQSEKGIMEKHRTFNINGKAILVAIISAQKAALWKVKRAGIILIKHKKILLIKRNKYGNQYYAMPGGTVEPNESVEQSAKREITEETNLKFKIDPTRKPIHIYSPREEYYFFGTHVRGKAELGGPEKLRNDENNSYELQWIPTDKLEKINLIPEILKQNLIKALV
ncbi:MAG: NUDIX domain-containing protein [Patescibacteria group bacterium]